MCFFQEQEIEQYIATYNLYEALEPSFVYSLLKQLTKDLIGVENTKCPIKQENIFDFITGPDNRNKDIEIKDQAWINKYRKNIHIVMAVIDQIEKEEKSSSNINEKFDAAKKFCDATLEIRNLDPILKKINSRLTNVYFFDDDVNNINLAQELGVNTYLVNSFDDENNLNACLSTVSEKIAALQQQSEDSTLTSPSRSSASVFSPLHLSNENQQEEDKTQNSRKKRKFDQAFESKERDNNNLPPPPTPPGYQ